MHEHASMHTLTFKLSVYGYGKTCVVFVNLEKRNQLFLAIVLHCFICIQKTQ